MAPGIHSTNASATQQVDHIGNDAKAEGTKQAQQSHKSASSGLVQSMYDAIAAYHPAHLAKQLGSGLPDLAGLLDTVRQRLKPCENLLRNQLGQLGGAHGTAAPQNRKRIAAMATATTGSQAATVDQVRSLGEQHGVDTASLKRLEAASDVDGTHGTQDTAQLTGKLTEQALSHLQQASARPATNAAGAAQTALVVAARRPSTKPTAASSEKPSLKEHIDAHLPKFADVFPPPKEGEHELTLEEFKAAFAIYAEISRQVAAFCQELFGSSANAQGANHMPEPAPINIDGYLRQHADDIKRNASAAQQDGKPVSA